MAPQPSLSLTEIMKTYIYSSILTGLSIVMTALPAAARMPEASDVTVSDLRIGRDGSRLNVAFELGLGGMPVGRNVETRITPVVKCGNDSVLLGSVTLAGRNRMIQAQRDNRISSEENTYYRAGKTSELPYSASVGWQSWMENAEIELLVENLGCCSSRKTIADRALARLDMGERAFDVGAGQYEYITPVEERVKMRSAKGEAYVDFVVNTTDIRPGYRSNHVELAKIRATIDSIKSDPDTKITSLTITGYASPEGPYRNNERLAKGRTEALAEYVRKLYTFPKDLMKTSWVAEDWVGLRRMVEKSNLNDKAEILKVIDSDMAPDAKDAALKSRFPKSYAVMLADMYPALRHSDYTVAYEVRKYTDPAEIAEVFKRNPSKLSLRELFIYAETLEPSSPEYADVLQTAARMYPEDTTANLNAANCALQSGDLTEAARYLAKAGDTPQAAYARGILAAKQGDYAAASEEFTKAAAGGIDVTAVRASLARMTAPEVLPL